MSVLLLQGPLGPFFKQLNIALVDEGYSAHRIVFNGGDAHYSDSDATVFDGSLHDWGNFFTDFIRVNNIKTVLVYGDCRAYHMDAKRVCIHNNVQYFALEEGYLRPNYITIEEGGVNGHSPITHNAISQYDPIHSPENEEIIPANFLKRVIYAVVYYTAGALSKRQFSQYKHHRSFAFFYNPYCWVRGFMRKALYKILEPSADKICGNESFFLVPLQVHDDMQIKFHCDYKSVDDFICYVLESFSNSNSDANLVFKHHPMDRGYVNYRKLIFDKARQLNIVSRVSYIHDQHLPTLLKSCSGVVTINSTTALQAFYHGAPVIAKGDAFFDMPGLTYQGSLESFWHAPVKPDPIFADQFKAYLLDHGQINGSFYCESDMTIKNLIHYLKKLSVL